MEVRVAGGRPRPRFFLCVIIAGLLSITVVHHLIRPVANDWVDSLGLGTDAGRVFKFVVLFWATWLLVWLFGRLFARAGVVTREEGRRFPLAPE